MGKLNSHADKSEYSTESTNLIELNKDRIAAAGFDVTAKIDDIKAKIAATDAAATARNDAHQVAKEKTAAYNASLADTYTATSALVNILEGVLGANDPLVKTLIDMRN
jgi:hypothetical protein